MARTSSDRQTRRRCGRTTLLVLLLSFILSSSYADEANQDAYYSTLQQGPCFNVKIQGDDDDEEGNSYFYNGAYRAQYERYVSFQACVQEDGGYEEGGYEVCSLYVSALEDFMNPAVEYLQSYCTACGQNCRRNLRFLEEGENNYDVTVDCSTCSEHCSYENNGQTNEANMLECQEQQQNNRRKKRRLDEVGYYTAPGCYDGHVVIGQFYDDECSIKAGNDLDQDYPLFESLATMPFDCSSNNDICQELLGDATSCDNNGDDDTARLCRAASNASRQKNYAHKRPWYLRPGHWVALIILGSVAGVGLAFLSYTYYVRHTSSRKVPMASLDNNEGDAQKQQQSSSEEPQQQGIGSNGAYAPAARLPPWAKLN